MARLIKNESKDAQARAVLDLEYSQALDLDRKALRSAVDGLCHDIELQLSELDSHGSGSLDKTRQVVGSLFVADDKLLSSLQKLGWELETEDPQEKEDVKKLQDMCARLIKYSVEACRTRLDRIFLDSLEAASSANGRHAAQGEDLATVQDELESLYSEILPVAQMSVDQQYLAPALKSLTSRNGKSFAKTAHAIDYVSLAHLCDESWSDTVPDTRLPGLFVGQNGSLLLSYGEISCSPDGGISGGCNLPDRTGRTSRTSIGEEAPPDNRSLANQEAQIFRSRQQQVTCSSSDWAGVEEQETVFHYRDPRRRDAFRTVAPDAGAFTA